MQGLTVDYAGLARGIVGIMDEESKDVLKAGMIPRAWINLALEQFIAKCDREGFRGDLIETIGEFREKLSSALLQAGA